MLLALPAILPVGLQSIQAPTIKLETWIMPVFMVNLSGMSVIISMPLAKNALNVTVNSFWELHGMWLLTVELWGYSLNIMNILIKFSILLQIFKGYLI